MITVHINVHIVGVDLPDTVQARSVNEAQDIIRHDMNLRDDEYSVTNVTSGDVRALNQSVHG